MDEKNVLRLQLEHETDRLIGRIDIQRQRQQRGELPTEDSTQLQMEYEDLRGRIRLLEEQ